MTAGEWLAYTVNVPSDGLYAINVRIGSALPGRTFHIEIEGVDATGPVGCFRWPIRISVSWVGMLVSLAI
jgi:hypothetical protein